MDLVSYNEKHNMANGEKGRDGTNDNFSSNCGHEGHTDDPAIQALRWRQMRNFHLALMISQGTPMIVSGKGDASPILLFMVLHRKARNRLIVRFTSPRLLPCALSSTFLFLQVMNMA